MSHQVEDPGPSNFAVPIAAAAEPLPDLELVQAVLRRDRKATAIFVASFTDAAYAYVRRRLVPRIDLVDDLVQEVFVAALESLGTFAGTSSLRTWLLGIARHKIEDHYRACSKQYAAPLDQDTDLIEGVRIEYDEELDGVRRQARLDSSAPFFRDTFERIVA